MEKNLELEVNKLETQLNNLFEFVKNEQSFHDHVLEQYKRYKEQHQGLDKCYQEHVDFYLKNIIYRYSGELGSGYHISVESVQFEQKLWSFAQHNPEQWFLMIEKIAFTDHSANVYHIDGFSFMDNFIHNGIYDDWCLGIAKKQDNMFFFDITDTKKEEEYKKSGYIIEYLDEETMKQLLDEIEAKNNLTKTVKLK